jgi:hypothetical protein
VSLAGLDLAAHLPHIPRIMSLAPAPRIPLRLALLALALTCFYTTSYGELQDFETWRFDLQDANDEHALDNLLFDYDRRWEESWWIARNGARMANGCGTHEKWEMHTEIKLERELGRRFRANYRYDQQERFSHRSEYHEFSGAWRPVPGFLLGALYRPRFAKAEQDLGFYIGVEPDSLQAIYLVYVNERWLNNRIARKHSLFEEERWHYESSPHWLELSGRLRLAGSGLAAFEVGALSPTDRLYMPPSYSNSVQPTYRQNLRGDRGRLRVWSPRAGALSGRVELGWKRGRDALAPLVADSIGVPPPRDVYRRERWLRPGLVYQLGATLRAEALIEYREKQEENATATAPGGVYLYRSHSRILYAGVEWDPLPWLALDGGYAYNSVSIEETDDPEWIVSGARHGSRRENRFVLTVDVRWQGLSVLFRESFELDRENYASTGTPLHDKSFIQIMLTL